MVIKNSLWIKEKQKYLIKINIKVKLIPNLRDLRLLNMKRKCLKWNIDMKLRKENMISLWKKYKS
jgi:hypothetical protein